MNLRRPATLAVTLAALLAATLPASAEDNLYNPDPTRCDYVTIAISNNPDAAVNPGQATEIVRKDSDGLYKFHLKVEVHDPLRLGQTVTIKSIRIKCKDDDSNSFDVVPAFTPPSYNATVEIPPDKARGTKKWCVEVTTESSTTNPPAQGATTTNDPCEKDFTLDHGDCTDCPNCNTTGDPTVSNDGGGFTADMPLGRSDGGDTTGSLRFRTKDMSFPGLEGISVFVPSSVAVERTLANQTAPHSATNKFVKISFATLTTNIEAKPTVVNNVEVADSITITHTLKNATPPFRTTTISKITESGITWLRADSSFGGTTTRHQQKKAGDTYTMQSGPFTTGFTMLREVDLTITPDTQSGTEVHREIVRENDVPVSDIKTTWANFSWGWEKIEEIIDPDGYPLTSSWTYYMTDKGTGPPDTDDAGSEEGYGRIETYVRSDGYMETHYYWHNNHTTILPFAGAQQGLTLSRQWNDNHTTRTTTRTVGTKMLSEESESYTDSTTTPSSTVPTITTTTKASSGATLTTTTTLKPYSARFGGQPASVLHPDGTLTTYEYTYADGIKTVTMNTGIASNNEFSQGKSTTTTYNSQGFITNETVSDIASEVVLSVRDAMLVDLFGRVTKWTYVLRAELTGVEISELRSEDFHDISPLTWENRLIVVVTV